MNKILENKVAIVTGGNSGIGEATAHLFSEQGAKVIIMARRDEEGKRVESEIIKNGGEATFIKCDVGDENIVNSAISKAAEVYGEIHILFNNAGHGAAGDFPESTTEDWNTVINDNLNGTFFVSRAVWPYMVNSGGGAIVNMSSLAAQRGFSPKMKEEFGTTAPSYYVAKAGIDALKIDKAFGNFSGITAVINEQSVLSSSGSYLENNAAQSYQWLGTNKKIGLLLKGYTNYQDVDYAILYKREPEGHRLGLEIDGEMGTVNLYNEITYLWGSEKISMPSSYQGNLIKNHFLFYRTIIKKIKQRLI